MFRKILVGYDGSAQSEHAVLMAFTLAKSLDSEVLILSVARPPEPPTDVELEAQLDDAREHFEVGFDRLLANAREMNLPARTEILVGHPAEQIIRKAETEKFDLVVLGHRGTTVFHRWVMGSISEKVLRHAHCPVLITR